MDTGANVCLMSSELFEKIKPSQVIHSIPVLGEHGKWQPQGQEGMLLDDDWRSMGTEHNNKTAGTPAGE